MAALHPSGLTFFAAFGGQFIDPDRPLLIQSSQMVFTFVVVAGFTSTTWLLIASRLEKFAVEGQMQRVAQRFSGFVCLSIAAWGAGAILRLW